MQSRKNKSSNCVNQSSQRILSEQLAINSQIKKYKLNYHSKAVQKENIDSFIRFSRQLQLLIISYCKNIIYVAPENLSIIIEELTLLFDDLLKKYHQLFLKHHQKFSQSAVHEVKRHSLSELCVVCGQQMKKISIDKMKSYIMNEIGLKGLQKYEESDSSKQQEDLQFFQQVNNLLNIKHGELIKNQIEINNYKEMALDALSYLKAFKDNFTRQNLLLPNSAWLTSAKEEMQMVLKQSFQDKIPPWISKMLTAFWNHYRQQIEKKKCEIGTQTDNNTQLEILELRKKVLIGKEKLQAEQDLIKIQERQLIGLREQNINLQAKIDYYKNELTKLNEEMGNVNMENQIFKIKIRNSKLVQEIQNNEAQKDSNNDQKHQISRSYIIDSRITNQNGNKNNHQSVDQRVFPKIKRESTSKNSQQIRNSMKVDFSNKSGRSQLKKTTKKIEKISGATIGKSSKNEQMSMILNETFQSIVPNEKQQKLHKQSHQISDSSQMQKTKNYEFGELSNDDYKLRIKEVDQQMKMAVKQGTCFKNGLKHLSSASQHCTLKKVPRKMTNHQELDQSKIEINQNQLSPFQKSHYLLKQSKIYNSLKQAGYSINISEQEFKESILKIKQFNPDLSLILKPNECSQTKRSFMNVKRHQIEKQPLPRGSLYQYSSFNGHKYINNSLNHSFDQKTVNSYLPLFINIQNAYIYETKLSKSHFNSAIKLQASQHSLCQQLYELISQINKANIEHYRLICSFLRFPYQIFSNGLGSLNVGNDMKYGTFEFYFQRILSIHQKCMKQEAVCQHLRQFRKRLSEKYQSLRKDN